MEELFYSEKYCHHFRLIVCCSTNTKAKVQHFLSSNPWWLRGFQLYFLSKIIYTKEWLSISFLRLNLKLLNNCLFDLICNYSSALAVLCHPGSLQPSCLQDLHSFFPLKCPDPTLPTSQSLLVLSSVCV